MLIAAGLGRYTDRLPDPGLPMAATTAELADLLAAVHALLNENLYRLFLRNCGAGFAFQALRDPWGRSVLARLETIPPAAALGWVVGEFASLPAPAWTLAEPAEDIAAWYLTTVDCHLCAGIHWAGLPLCTAAVEMYKRLAEQLTHQRVPVIERACRALGAPHCQFMIPKRAGTDMLTLSLPRLS